MSPRVVPIDPMARQSKREAASTALTVAVAHLLRALADCEMILPQPVMDAADEIRRAVAGLGGEDIGPPP